MDARLFRGGLLLTTVLTATATVSGSVYKTPNFTVDAPSPEIAEQVGKAAEVYRRELAIDWLGKPLPRWSKPCPIKVKVGQIGAGGATSFAFDRGEVFGWKMNIQGSLERILDSVLPHEVSHTIFACHFRRPLPRWADEGAATLVEHESERLRQIKLLEEVLGNGTRFPMRELLSMKEYPTDMRKVLTLYAQGYSLAEFLIQQEGKTTYLEFLEDAHNMGWDKAIHRHYAHKNVETLEKRWSSWVMAGSPKLNIPKNSQLADNRRRSTEGLVVRGQSPDTPTPPARRNRTAALQVGEAPDPVAAAERLRQRAQELTMSESDPSNWSIKRGGMLNSGTQGRTAPTQRNQFSANTSQQQILPRTASHLERPVLRTQRPSEPTADRTLEGRLELNSRLNEEALDPRASLNNF